MDETILTLFASQKKIHQMLNQSQNTYQETVITSEMLRFTKIGKTQQIMLQEQKIGVQPLVQPLQESSGQDLTNQSKKIESTSFCPKQLQIINVLKNHEIKSQNSEDSVQLQEYEDNVQSSQQQDMLQFVKKITSAPNVVSLNTRKNMRKNSNAIKKMGRIILNNIRQFAYFGQKNQGVQQMQEMLAKRAKDKRRPKDIRDGFNTSHLEALFQCQPKISSHNLRVAKRLFEKKLRTQIFSSPQIQDINRLLYLNTLKCAALRFSNKKLAVRLQLSESK